MNENIKMDLLQMYSNEIDGVKLGISVTAQNIAENPGNCGKYIDRIAYMRKYLDFLENLKAGVELM